MIDINTNIQGYHVFGSRAQRALGDFAETGTRRIFFCDGVPTSVDDLNKMAIASGDIHDTEWSLNGIALEIAMLRPLSAVKPGTIVCVAVASDGGLQLIGIRGGLAVHVEQGMFLRLIGDTLFVSSGTGPFTQAAVPGGIL